MAALILDLPHRPTPRDVMPAIGTSLSLIAVGAILRYAVTATVSGVSLPTVGLILMIAGAAGLVISLSFTALHYRKGSRSARQRSVQDPRRSFR